MDSAIASTVRWPAASAADNLPLAHAPMLEVRIAQQGRAGSVDHRAVRRKQPARLELEQPLERLRDTAPRLPPRLAVDHHAAAGDDQVAGEQGPASPRARTPRDRANARAYGRRSAPSRRPRSARRRSSGCQPTADAVRSSSGHGYFAKRGVRVCAAAIAGDSGCVIRVAVGHEHRSAATRRCSISARSRSRRDDRDGRRRHRSATAVPRSSDQEVGIVARPGHRTGIVRGVAAMGSEHVSAQSD